MPTVDINGPENPQALPPYLSINKILNIFTRHRLYLLLRYKRNQWFQIILTELYLSTTMIVYTAVGSLVRFVHHVSLLQIRTM